MAEDRRPHQVCSRLLAPPSQAACVDTRAQRALDLGTECKAHGTQRAGRGCTPEGAVAQERLHFLYAVQHQGGIMLPSDMYSQPNAADPVLEERKIGRAHV